MTQERPAIESERARPKFAKVMSSSWLIMKFFFAAAGSEVGVRAVLMGKMAVEGGAVGFGAEKGGSETAPYFTPALA